VRAILALLLAFGFVAGASAHSTGRHVGFVSTVSGVEPPTPGLLVNVVGAHERLSVRNWTQKTVVIFDERGRPAVELAPGEMQAWDDPRIGSSEPPPEQAGLVRNWRIRGTADGEPFAIVGFLGYRPPPGVGGPGLPTWAIVLAGMGGALVLAAVLALPLRRREGEDERAETAPTEP
jgi:hypothetical protein